MKIVRYGDGLKINWGVIEGDAVREMDGDPFEHFHLTSNKGFRYKTFSVHPTTYNLYERKKGVK